jgi:hypothetical protein
MRHASVPTSSHLCVDNIPGTAFGENAVSSVSVRGLKGVSHENQEGSKAVSIERSTFKDVLAWSF